MNARRLQEDERRQLTRPYVLDAPGRALIQSVRA